MTVHATINIVTWAFDFGLLNIWLLPVVLQTDEEAITPGLRAEESQQGELKVFKPTQLEEHNTAEQVIYSFGNHIL